MTGQAPLGVDLQPPGSLRLPAPVWGIDPSTKRISVACVRNGLEWTQTLSLPQLSDPIRRYAAARDELVPWLHRLLPSGDGTTGWPSHVFVEEPFAPKERRQVPTSYLMLGVLWVALVDVLPHETKFAQLSPGAWKKRAIGDGRGHAKKDEVFDWARGVAGYEGSLQDEADAVGVATAGGVIVSGG